MTTAGRTYNVEEAGHEPGVCLVVPDPRQRVFAHSIGGLNLAQRRNMTIGLKPQIVDGNLLKWGTRAEQLCPARFPPVRAPPRGYHDCVGQTAKSEVDAGIDNSPHPLGGLLTRDTSFVVECSGARGPCGGMKEPLAHARKARHHSAVWRARNDSICEGLLS